jgi:nitric oxide reductase NorQ protein
VADPHFIASDDVIQILTVTHEMSKKHPTSVLITGHPGGGKTSIALQLAAIYKRPCVVIDFGILQEPQQLFQTTYLVEGHNGNSVTDVRETGFVKGMETRGCVCVLEELNRPENERVLNPLLPFLDNRGGSWIEDLRRRVVVAPEVIFVATLNEGAMFCGVTSIDTALRDRFREINLEYIPTDQEAKVLMDKIGVAEEIAYSLAQFAYTVRQTPSITRKVSTRQLIHAAEAHMAGDELWRAVSSAIGHYNDPSWRQQVMEILSLSFRSDDEYTKWLNKSTEPVYSNFA